MSLAKATGEGITIKIKGKDYKLSPILMEDMAMFEQYIKEDKIALITKSVKDENTKYKLITDVMNSNISGLDIDKAMDTMSGSAFMLWRSLKDSKLTLDEVKKLIEMSNLKEITAAIAGMAGVPEKK